MSQETFGLPDQARKKLRLLIESTIQAMVTLNSGENPPPELFPGMLWADTQAGRCRMRSQDNLSWINMWSLSSGIDSGSGGAGGGAGGVSGAGNAWQIASVEPSHNSIMLGDGWYSTTDNTLRIFDGTNFVVVGSMGESGETGATGPGVPSGGVANQVIEKIDETDYNTRWTDLSTGSTTVQDQVHSYTKQNSGFTDYGSIEDTTWTDLYKSSGNILVSNPICVKNTNELWYLKSAGIFYFGNNILSNCGVETKYLYQTCDTEDGTYSAWADVQLGTIEHNISLRTKLVSGQVTLNFGLTDVSHMDYSPYLENPTYISSSMPTATVGKFVKIKIMMQLPDTLFRNISARYGFYLSVSAIQTKEVQAVVSEASEELRGTVKIASDANIQTGTDTNKAISPAGLKTLFGAGYYESALTTFTPNQFISFDHGLGRTPILYRAVLECRVAEGGYVVGEQMDIGLSRAGGAGLSANTTSISAFVNDDFYTKTGQDLTVTAAKWGWRCYAF